jgi:hypothetical protein
MKYDLEKRIWTDADFEQMSWNDCMIYKMRVSGDLVLDIDYILQWNQPDVEGLPFTFWIAPATLVFKQVQNLILEIDTTFTEAYEIEDIEKRVTETGITWTIITQRGYIEFTSEGYEQFIRQEPFFQFGPLIPYIDRHGVSLERTTEQENPNRLRDDITARRQQELKDYEQVKLRQLKRKEKEAHNKSKTENKIDTKDYLNSKKEIEDALDLYDRALKGTIFEEW